MSRILDFRDSVEAWVRATCPELREVDWYDGQFDITDLRNWTAKPPCAFIAASTGTGDLVVTGESQANLECVLVLCDQDNKQGRDADRRVWEMMERCFIDLRLQDFGNEWATASWDVRMRRLMDPVIRREGVAFGVVTWCSGVTLGHNRARERDLIYGEDGEPITQVPRQLGVYADIYGHRMEDLILDEDGRGPEVWHNLPPPGGVPIVDNGFDPNGFALGAGYDP